MPNEFLTTYLPSILALGSLVYAAIQTKLSKQQLEVAQLQNVKAKELFSGADEYFGNVNKAMDKIDDIIQEGHKSDGEINILNFGLDLETVMPWLKNELLQNEEYDNIKINYRGLIINPDSAQIKHLINGSSNIKEAYVKASIESAESISLLNFPGINLELRSYNIVPFFHGFIINKKHLFISYTEVIAGKMVGGTFPYVYIKLDNTSKLNKHLFNMFLSWFEYIWSTSESKIKVTT